MATIAILMTACSGPAREDAGHVEHARGPARGGAEAPGGCSEDADCTGLERCFPPSVPICGGADQPPLLDCPAARPFRVIEGCREVCRAERPRACTDGFACRHGGVCRPSAPDRDQNGCSHLPCARSAECDGGTCVNGRCYDEPGRCEEMPATTDGAGARNPPRTECPDGTFWVERCISGGMAPMPGEPQSNRSCIEACEASPPGGSPAMMCAEVEPNRFRCEGFAP